MMTKNSAVIVYPLYKKFKKYCPLLSGVTSLVLARVLGPDARNGRAAHVRLLLLATTPWPVLGKLL